MLDGDIGELKLKMAKISEYKLSRVEKQKSSIKAKKYISSLLSIS